MSTIRQLILELQTESELRRWAEMNNYTVEDYFDGVYILDYQVIIEDGYILRVELKVDIPTEL